MSFSEKHKNILMILGGFLFFLLGAWLFYLRGNAAAIAEADKQYEKQMVKEIEKLANKNSPALVEKLASDFRMANQELDANFKKVAAEVLWKFTTPLIPADAMPQTYVRMRLRDERDYAARQLSTVKNIKLHPAAQLLGMDLPADVGESLRVDEAWMRQILVMRRFIDVILSLPEEKANEQPVLSISILRPLPPVNTGTPPAFLREHPVEAEMQITMSGLIRLLSACAKTETMHNVRYLGISADPVARQTRFVRQRDLPTLSIKDWFTHYYTVRIIVSSVEALTAEEQKQQKGPAKAAPVRTNAPIPH